MVYYCNNQTTFGVLVVLNINPLNAELNPICYLLALLAHIFSTLAE